jgi:hypothetical protein
MITDKEYRPILIIDNENDDGRNIVYDITMTLGYKYWYFENDCFIKQANLYDFLTNVKTPTIVYVDRFEETDVEKIGYDNYLKMILATFDKTFNKTPVSDNIIMMIGTKSLKAIRDRVNTATINKALIIKVPEPVNA